MYYRPRIIPCLSIDDGEMVKTIHFQKPRYLGDVVNAVKIFNNKGVDELSILDISATRRGKGPNFDLLKDIATEAFMPLSYGGGVTEIEQIKKLFYIGYEKIIMNTAFVKNSQLVQEAVRFSGSQSVVVSIDAKADLFGRYTCYVGDGQEKLQVDPIQLAKQAQELGAGEILLNSINRDGDMNGYDLKLVKNVADSVDIPVIACGGAGKMEDIKAVLQEGHADAAAAGSFFVYYGRNKAILITAPSEQELVQAGIYSNE